MNSWGEGLRAPRLTLHRLGPRADLAVQEIVIPAHDGPGDALLPLLDPLDEGKPLVEGLSIHEDEGGGAVLGEIHGLTGLVTLGTQGLEVALKIGDGLIARHDNSFHMIVWKIVGQRYLHSGLGGHGKGIALWANDPAQLWHSSSYMSVEKQAEAQDP